MSTLTRNEQIALLIREIESSDEPAIITTSYMLELFEDFGFDRFLGMYGYVAHLYQEEKLKAFYYHISKTPTRLQEDCEDQEL